MGKETTSAGQGVVLLTALGAASQLLGFGYRVVLSRLVGAEVMGLYQLVMPVYSVLLSLTAVGLTSAVSNLTAQHLALGNRRVGRSRRCTPVCGLFSLVLLPVGAVADLWVGRHLRRLAGGRPDPAGADPAGALRGPHRGGELAQALLLRRRAWCGLPAVAELLEQLVRTAAVLGLLVLFLPQYPERAVGLIVAGMVICEVFSAVHPGGPRTAGAAGAFCPGPESRGPSAADACRHRPARGPQRPAGQSAGGGQRRPHPPEAGGGRHGPGGRHRPAGGGVRHDPAHAGPAHGVSGGAESGAAAPAGPGQGPGPVGPESGSWPSGPCPSWGCWPCPPWPGWRWWAQLWGGCSLAARWTAICCPWPSSWL